MAEERSAPTASTELPDKTINNGGGTNRSGWRTKEKITGKFDAGKWELHSVVRAVTAGGAVDGAITARIWRGSAEDGTGATLLTETLLTGSTFTNLTTADQDSLATWEPGAAIELSGEYLFVEVAIKITGAGTGSTQDCDFRYGDEGVRLVTPNFTTTTGTAWAKELADTVSPTDAIGKASSKVLGDTATNADSVVKGARKVLADTSTVSDVVIKTTAKVLSDTASLSDVVAKLVGKLLADTQTPSDGVSKQPRKLLSESITLSDTLARVVFKVLVDNVSPTDAVSKRPTKMLADTATPTDSLSAARVIIRGLTDTVEVLDALVKVPSKMLFDTASPADVLAKGPRKGLVDTVTTSDALAKQPAKVLSDTVNVSDAIAASRVLLRLLQDTVTLVDALAKTPQKVLVDEQQVSDSLANRIAKVFADLAELEDVVDLTLISGAQLFRKLLADTVSVADAIRAVRLIAGSGLTGTPQQGSPGAVVGENPGDFSHGNSGETTPATTGSPAGGRSRL